MPASFALPPVEYCFGTRPIHAANSLPLRNAAPLPIAATIAVATKGPMPGICLSRVHAASLEAIRSTRIHFVPAERYRHVDSIHPNSAATDQAKDPVGR